MDLTEPYLSESPEACLLVPNSQVEETQYKEYAPSNIFNSLTTLRGGGSAMDKEDIGEQKDVTDLSNKRGPDRDLDRTTQPSSSRTRLDTEADQEDENCSVDNFVQRHLPRGNQDYVSSPGQRLIQNIVQSTPSDPESEQRNAMLVVETASSGEEELTVPGNGIHNGAANGAICSISETESGGISDAPTAVVSDTEGHGQVFVKRQFIETESRGIGDTSTVVPGVLGMHSVSAFAGSSPERSSNTLTTSNLSSFSSSSSDERDCSRNTGLQLQRKRSSLVSNECINTSPCEQGTDSKMPGKKSSDGKSVIQKEQLEDKEVPPSSSQEDLFTCSQNTSQKVRITATPSEHVGSLQFSQHSVLAADTLESDSQSESYIPPSPEAYGSAPIIIPSSPTALSDVEEEEGVRTEVSFSLGHLSSVKKGNSQLRSVDRDHDVSGTKLDITLTSTLDESHRRVISRCQTEKSKGSSTSVDSCRPESRHLEHCPSSFPLDVSSMDDGLEESIVVLHQKEYVVEPTLKEDVTTPDRPPAKKSVQTSKASTPRKLFENDESEKTGPLQADVNRYECINKQIGLKSPQDQVERLNLIHELELKNRGNTSKSNCALASHFDQKKRSGLKPITDDTCNMPVATDDEIKIIEDQQKMAVSPSSFSHKNKSARLENVQHRSISVTEQRENSERSVVEMPTEDSAICQSAKQEEASITILEDWKEEFQPMSTKNNTATEAAHDWSLHLTPSQGSTSQYTAVLSESTEARGNLQGAVEKVEERPCSHIRNIHCSEKMKSNNRQTSAMSVSSEASAVFQLSVPKDLTDSPDFQRQRHFFEEQVEKQSQTISMALTSENDKHQDRSLERKNPVVPTLTLDMIHTQSENSEEMTEFMVERPDTVVSYSSTYPRQGSLFSRVKETTKSDKSGAHHSPNLTERNSEEVTGGTLGDRDKPGSQVRGQDNADETQSYDWQEDLTFHNHNEEKERSQDTQIIGEECHVQGDNDPFEFRISQSQHDRQSLKKLTTERRAKKRKTREPQKERQSPPLSPKRKRRGKRKNDGTTEKSISNPQPSDPPRTGDGQEDKGNGTQRIDTDDRKKMSGRTRPGSEAGNSKDQSKGDQQRHSDGKQSPGRKRHHPESSASKDQQGDDQQGQDDSNKEKPSGSSGEPPEKIIRTVVEEIVTVRRIITEEVVVGGTVVKKTTREEKEEPVVRTSQRSNSMSTISPSRTVSSLTSGDLGDVSSLSKTTSISTTGAGSLSKSVSNVTSPSSGKESPARQGSVMERAGQSQQQSKIASEGDTQKDANRCLGGGSGGQTRSKSVTSNQTGGHEGDDELTQQISSGVVVGEVERAPSVDLLPPHAHTPVTDERTGSLQRTVHSFLSPAPPETSTVHRTLSSDRSLNKSSSSSTTSLKHSESLFTSPELEWRRSSDKTSDSGGSNVQGGKISTSPSAGKYSQALFTSPELKKSSSSSTTTSTTNTSTAVVCERTESIDDTVFTRLQAATVRKKRAFVGEVETSSTEEHIVSANISSTAPLNITGRPRRAASAANSSENSKADSKTGRRSNRNRKCSDEPKEVLKSGSGQRKDVAAVPKSRQQNRESSTSPVISLQSTSKATAQQSTATLAQQDVNVPGSMFEEQQRNLETGTNVLAKWKDGFYYPGIFISLEKNGKYLVYFDDEDQRQVKPSDVIVRPLLVVGLSVMVMSSDGYFDSAIICEMFQKEDQMQYLVELDSGKKKRISKSSIILSSDQAALLPGAISSKSAISPSTSTLHLGDVSLDNLIAGKRKRTPKSATVSSAVTAASEPSETSVLSSDSKGKPEVSQGRKGQKRKFSHLEPKATSTPTPKRMAARLGQGEITGISISSTLKMETEVNPFANIEQSPVTVRRSPRKARAGLFTEGKGPIPLSGSSFFQGCAFLLTNVEKTESEKKAERKFLQQGLDSSTDDSSIEEEEEETVPFDKYHLKAQIESGGGVVLEKFSLSQIQAAHQVFLISSTHQRTIKYLQCLAACIPCVSHIWIRDSCRTNQLLDHKAYLLPAGINIESKRLVEWNPRNKGLNGMTTLLVSYNKEVQQTWTSVLQTAGCHVTAKGPGQVSKSNITGKTAVVVTDSKCPKNVITMLGELRIPVVSTEWVIQSLISGHRMKYTGHGKYSYNYEEPN